MSVWRQGLSIGVQVFKQKCSSSGFILPAWDQPQIGSFSQGVRRNAQIFGSVSRVKKGLFWDGDDLNCSHFSLFSLNIELTKLTKVPFELFLLVSNASEYPCVSFVSSISKHFIFSKRDSVSQSQLISRPFRPAPSGASRILPTQRGRT